MLAETRLFLFRALGRDLVREYWCLETWYETYGAFGNRQVTIVSN